MNKLIPSFFLAPATLLLLSCLPFSASAQSRNNASNSAVAAKPAAVEAAPGTYQFIIKTTKATYAFTTETLRLIESKREQTKEVRIAINPQIDVRILPYAVINASAFKPLEERVYQPGPPVNFPAIPIISNSQVPLSQA